mgnify:CR=1 FL=1
MQCPTPNPLVFESDMLDERVNALQGDRPIAFFGLKALNDILGGVYPGLNYAIGTGPGKGKTTLALQEADKLAADGHPVIYVSTELPAHKLLEKSLARLSDNGLALSEVSNAAAADHPKHEVFEAALNAYRDRIAPNLCITGPLNTVELSNLVGLMARERNEAPIVFADYLQLLACGTTAGQQFIDERLAITACVKGLREISNLYGSPVIALSSTTRKSYESGKSNKPNLGMFGGSSTVEYSFDSVLFLADDDGKPDHAFEPPAVGTPLKLIALKNRYGTLGEARLDFDGAHATFLDRR